MGDLNIYRDFESPMDYLTAHSLRSLEDLRSGAPHIGCGAHVDQLPNDLASTETNAGSFRDVWEETGNNGNPAHGLSAWTFPNLAGASNDLSRCDRILVRTPPRRDNERTPVGIGEISIIPFRSAVVGCDNIANAVQTAPHSNERGSPLRRSDHRAVIVEFTFE